MLFGITHLTLPVRALEPARAFYADGLGFAPSRAGEGYLDLDAHGVGLRLLEQRNAAPCEVALRIEVRDLAAAIVHLLAAGARQLSPAAPNEGGEMVAQLADPDGHRLQLWRRLRESELPEPPPLPMTRDWQPSAEVLAHSLLALVPEDFRETARNGMTAEAELLCPPAQEVSPLHAARAYVRATPRLLRERLRQPLREHGFAPESLEDDFRC